MLVHFEGYAELELRQLCMKMVVRLPSSRPVSKVSPTHSAAGKGWGVEGPPSWSKQAIVSHSFSFSCFSFPSLPHVSLQAQCLLRARERVVIGSFFKHLFRAPP